MTRLRQILIAGSLLLAGFMAGQGLNSMQELHEHDATLVTMEDGQQIWTCSMHPQVRMDQPGDCPICGMELIPLKDDDTQQLGERQLKLSPAAAKLAEIQVSAVGPPAAEALIRLAGTVEFDETRLAQIAARMPGRLEKLYVDFTGATVQAGDKLVEIYSPELFSAQQELLESADNPALRRAAREKLRLWGLSDEQIQRIIKHGRPSDTLEINSPISGVVIKKQAHEGMYLKTGDTIYTIADLQHLWVMLDAYESDLPWLKRGQFVNFATTAGYSLQGQVVFIDPVLDPRTQTTKVRVEIDNAAGLIKPGMLVQASIRGELQHDLAGMSAIPASAPLITGKRAVVYVKQGDIYSGREIELGPRAGDHYIVHAGLEAGELVVTNGNFKIDSALQIAGQPSMMSPQGGLPQSGHQNHGAAVAATLDHESQQQTATIPAEFKLQLGSVAATAAELAAALAKDDFKLAAASLPALESGLNKIDMALLPHEPHLAWMKDLAKLNSALEQMKGATDIKELRSAFGHFNAALLSSIKQFGIQSETRLYRLHCPMSMDGKGGDWLQTGQQVNNPYYGAAMLRCGEVKEEIK